VGLDPIIEDCQKSEGEPRGIHPLPLYPDPPPSSLSISMDDEKASIPYLILSFGCGVGVGAIWLNLYFMKIED
jgi:hypothetical protein